MVNETIVAAAIAGNDPESHDCAEAQGGGEGRYRRVPLDALPEAFR